MFAVGTGVACVFLPNQAASLATISRSETGRATTIINVQRQVGAAVGVAALGSVLAAVGAIGGDATGFTVYRVVFAGCGRARLGRGCIGSPRPGR